MRRSLCCGCVSTTADDDKRRCCPSSCCCARLCRRRRRKYSCNAATSSSAANDTIFPISAVSSTMLLYNISLPVLLIRRSLSVLKAHFFTCSYSCFVLLLFVSGIKMMMIIIISYELNLPYNDIFIGLQCERATNVP